MATATKKKPSPAVALRRAERASEKFAAAKTDRVEAIRVALDAGASVTEVASAIGLTRAAIYKMIERAR
jgi:hypothetical protein